MTRLLNPIVLAFALSTLAFADASAQGIRHSLGTGDCSPLSIQLGLGVEAEPEYVGARTIRRSASPEINLSYRTESLGTIALGTEVGGLLWAPLETPFFSAGMMVSYDSGRKDGPKGSGHRPGGARLRGMGSIGGAAAYGGFVSATIEGLELSAYALKTPSGRGSGGAQGTLSLTVPIMARHGVEMSLEASLNAADRRYMQAYFGVDALQSERSGLRRHAAAGGLKSAGATLEVSYALSKAWTLHGELGAERLMGSAANSPVTERRVQPHESLGLSYRF